jgi:hypothetical protein
LQVIIPLAPCQGDDHLQVVSVELPYLLPVMRRNLHHLLRDLDRQKLVLGVDCLEAVL